MYTGYRKHGLRWGFSLAHDIISSKPEQPDVSTGTLLSLKPIQGQPNV